MKGMARLVRAGAWTVMPLFVAAAAGWRYFHREASDAGRTDPAPTVKRPSSPVREDILPDRAVSHPPVRQDYPSESAPEPPRERRAPRPGTDRAYREEARARLAADPEEFERTARGRLMASAPLAEKAALLKVSLEGAPERADRLYALALDGGKTSDLPLQEAALNLLIRELKSSRDPAPAWERLRAFVAGPPSLTGPDLRRRGAEALAAAAPERKLVEIATLAARDPDPEIRRALAAGLARNSAPGVGDFALLNGLNFEEGASLADGNIRDRGNSEED